jgi:two-component system phosphate regulon sensor histidine kinase PhoR
LIRYASDRSLLIARDVSQLMRLEQVRRDFVANVSHELRTPLTVVHGYLDLIEPEQMQEYEPILRELRNQSRRMTQIVEDLLTLSRLEAQIEIPSERVVMRPLIEALRREAVALSQGQHTVSVEIRSPHDLRGSVKDLHSAFSNLVSNAVRYTPPGGRITLRWESDANGGRLSVIDTGQGIPAQHLPRLTERFYRVSTSRSRETGGTGLGLSIVKHVLQLHQARLEITSELGAGSVFSCVFGPERLLEPQALAEIP